MACSENPHVDEPLAAQAIAGDRGALEQLLLAHYDRLAARIRRQLPDDLSSQLDVEDVLQETFVQAFQGIGRLTSATGHGLAAWLDTIADHRVQDAMRRARTQKRGGAHRQAELEAGSRWLPMVELLAGETDTPSQIAAQHEAVKALQLGVAGLEPDQREAIRLHCLERLTVEDTAKAMQRSPAAVRGLVQRGKIVLRSVLARSSRWLSKR
jgi:RNA polymerase sigma-70 factor (ECF subfamily)